MTIVDRWSEKQIFLYFIYENVNHELFQEVEYGKRVPVHFFAIYYLRHVVEGGTRLYSALIKSYLAPPFLDIFHRKDEV